jgi:xanthine dehydrogenase accessory factor
MLKSWFVQAVCELQNEGEDLVLATVLSKSGSAPCLAGAKMAVRTNGESIGTVGGGVLEATTQKKSAEVFESRHAEVLSFNLSGSDAASMQMICGGNVKVLLDYVPATPSNIEVFRELRDALQTGEKCYLVASLGEPEEEQRTTLYSLVLEDGSVIGEFPHSQQWRERLVEKAYRSTYPVTETIEGQQFVIERCFVPSVAIICGAGHVGAQVAQLAEMVDFQTVMIDDRSELANRELFPNAVAIKVPSDFEDSFAGLDVDGDSYVVIVTRGHVYDKTVLAQALRTQAGYIGMMGSKGKRKEVFKALRAEGFSAEELERVHSPIGLAIGAGTPSEIAVSIVAELIQTRAQASE